MPFLSRKYIRLLTYSLIIILLIFTLNYYNLIKNWIKDYKYKQIQNLIDAKYDLDSIIDQFNVNPNDHLMINIGLIQCFHLSNIFQWCPRSYQLFQYKKYPTYNHNNDPINVLSSHYTNRRIINKDIIGSFHTDWFGKSLYYFYDTIDISNIVPLLSYYETNIHNNNNNNLKVFKSILVISNNNNRDNDKYIQFDRFYLEPVDLSIDLLKSNRIYNTVADFTVLFGADCVDPRPNWHLMKSEPIYDQYLYDSYLSYKTLPIMNNNNNTNSSSSKSGGDDDDYDDDDLIELYPDLDGKFKIVQLSDLHMGVGEGECLDEYPIPTNRDSEICKADPKTTQFINRVLDIERPQLVIFTGDQVMGHRSLQDSETTLLKAVSPVIERKIPWALTWGNHDDEGSLSRWQLSELVVSLPYTIFQFSQFDTRDNSFGVGNYIKQVKQRNGLVNGSGLPLATFYFLDSHKYSKSNKLSPGYDWIKEAQWDYMKQMYENNLKSDILKVPNHLSMAFFHIPLPEYLNQRSKKAPDSNNEMVGTFKEGVTAPKYNSGGLTTLDSMGVQVTSCGHDHCNDYCLKDDSTPNRNIWLCYGGSAGEGAYAGYGGTERRIRIYELDTKVGSIKSWKRLNGSPEEIFDFQVLVNNQSI